MTRKPILVVEDDHDLLDALCETLSDEGFVCARAKDGWEALELLRSGFDPAVVLIDLKMPRMSGAEFLAKRAGEAEAIAQLPVVVLTGDNTAISEAERLGASAIVRKPATAEALVAVLRRFVDQ